VGRKSFHTLAFAVIMLLIFTTPAYANDDVPAAVQDNIPTVDEVMGRITGGKEFSVSLDEFTNIVIQFAINVIRLLQTIAAPVAIIAMIGGAIVYVAGLVTINTNLRRAGAGSITGSILFFILIKMAPVIVATIEGFVK